MSMEIDRHNYFFINYKSSTSDQLNGILITECDLSERK